MWFWSRGAYNFQAWRRMWCTSRTRAIALLRLHVILSLCFYHSVFQSITSNLVDFGGQLKRLPMIKLAASLLFAEKFRNRGSLIPHCPLNNETSSEVSTFSRRTTDYSNDLHRVVGICHFVELQDGLLSLLNRGLHSCVGPSNFYPKVNSSLLWHVALADLRH